MISARVDLDGNLVLINNRLVLIEGKEAMVQECWNRAFLTQGDDMFDADRGNFFEGTLKAQIANSEIVAGRVEGLVESHPDVISAEVVLTSDRENDTLNVEIEVDSQYGRMKI